ncbi:MAG: hypothetical protein ABSG80_02430 [Verrucomicrobiota bacterium]
MLAFAPGFLWRSGIGRKLRIEILNLLREKPDDGKVKNLLEGVEPVIFHSTQAKFNFGEHFPADAISQALEARCQSCLCPLLLTAPIGHLSASEILSLHPIALLNLRAVCFDGERPVEGIPE